jgi:hypothetical protein
MLLEKGHEVKSGKTNQQIKNGETPEEKGAEATKLKET